MNVSLKEFLSLKPGDKVIYRHDHETQSLQNLEGTIQDVEMAEIDGPFVTVKTTLGVFFTYWPKIGQLCFNLK